MIREATVKKDFLRDDADRTESLERARLCSALTKPWVLPPDGWKEDQKLPETFSSMAARGITNLEGRLLLALFPPGGTPWFRFKPAGRFRFDPEIAPHLLQEMQERLHMQELMILAYLEKSDTKVGTNSRRAGFRSRQRTALSQLLITGDVLTQLTDDFTIRVFRRDNYITKRDSTGDVLYHIIRESMDPLSLPEEKLVEMNLTQEDLLQKNPADRMEELYTRVQWQPLSKRWLIEQEVMGHIVNTSEERVTPFFSTPYELPPAANYGRGLIEQNLGDVRSINELTERLLDHAAIASKMMFALDYNSQVRPVDLANPTGSVIQARVQGGQVTDIGMLKADKMQDFSVANSVRDSIRKDLSITMLMESEQLPTYERATRLHVERVVSELEGALGGVYAPIADSMQIPLVERMREVLTRRRILPDLPDDTVEIEAVTGIQALSAEASQTKILQLMQTLAQLGPETMGRIDKGVLLDFLVRQSGIFEPGLVKSEEQMQQEMQQQQEAMMQQQAAQTAMNTAGSVIESEVAAGGLTQ